MKIWRDKKTGNRICRFTVECLPAECDACRLRRPHQKHSKRVQASLGDLGKEEAEIEANRLRGVEKLRARGKDPIPTLAEAVKGWIEDAETKVGTGELSEAYVKSVREFHRLHLYGMGNVAFDGLSTGVVEGMLNKHRVGRSASSVAAWLRIINVVGNRLVRRKVITELPWDVAMPTVQQEPRPVLSKEQTAAWVAAADAIAYRHLGKTEFKASSVALRLAIGLGLRESEILGARWELFRWSEDQQQWFYLPGRLVEGRFKSKGKRVKAKPVPSWLVTYLKPIWADLGLIVVGPDGQPFAQGMLRKVIAAANKACGTPGITPHRIRSSYATWLMAKVSDPKTAQQIMGHADLKTTMIYVEPDMAAATEALEQVGREIGLA